MTSIASDVIAARSGDTRAFSRLVDAHKNLVCSITLATLGDLIASQDVAQEVFVQAWLGLPKLRRPNSFTAWLRQLARHQALFARRTRSRQRARFIRDESVMVAAADTSPTAVERLERADDLQFLSETLALLPSDTRELILLYYREDSSAAELGERLGLSTEAVKKRLARARSQVRAGILERFGELAKKTAPPAAFVAIITQGLPSARAGSASLPTLLSSSKAFILVSVLAGGVTAAWWVRAEERQSTGTSDKKTERERDMPFNVEQTKAVLPREAGDSVCPKREAPNYREIPPEIAHYSQKVREIEGSHLTSIKDCIAKYRTAGGSEAVLNELYLTWMIERGGQASVKGFESKMPTDARRESLEKCVMDEMTTWQFPPPVFRSTGGVGMGFKEPLCDFPASN